MAQINQIITLIKYDYRNLLYFNNRMNLLKEQFYDKYNDENPFKIYLITKEKYNKKKKKEEYYVNLYFQNKYKYYIIFSGKLLSKYIRKQFPKDLIKLFRSMVITLLLEYFGIAKKIKSFFKFLK